MASYHNSFTYSNKNSLGEGFIIVSFEPDNGFKDTYLDIEQVSEESYDGTKSFHYGNKFNMKSTISITLVKMDGSDFTMAENRMLMRWLTGCRQASWLDLYVDDKFVYSFLGNFTSVKQRKLDARVVGIEATFTSINPWAWSILNSKKYELDGSTIEFDIENDTDDLYTYVNLNVDLCSEDGGAVTIVNETLGEETTISGMSPSETVKLMSSQIITSSIPNKIFGDNFNFVWPRLTPGINNFYIDGATNGLINFTYRYPIKVGDCAIDIDKLDVRIMFEGKISGAVGSADGADYIGRENITLTDITTKSPYEVSVIDGYLTFIKALEPNSNNSFAFIVDENKKTMNKIIISNNYLYISSNDEDVEYGRECAVFADKSTGLPYKVIAKDGSLYISEI